MTQAICFHCGNRKFGAFVRCPSCLTRPQEEEQLAVSFLLTDHFMNAKELAAAAQKIQERGERPVIAPATRQAFQETLQVGTALFREKSGRDPFEPQSNEPQPNRPQPSNPASGE